MEQIVSSAVLATAMPLELTWPDLLLRLAYTLIAGTIIGYNRGEHGKAAGLRTTLLVCMAASVAMLQMNYLLTLSGRTSNSFVMNDLMRLPLGILTGVGFIGGGAILRRDNIIIGVTTAATLWYVTVIGLCFGGGQVLLGWAATALGCLVLWVLNWFEAAMAREQHARLTISLEAESPSENQIRARLTGGAIEIPARQSRDGGRTAHLYFQCPRASRRGRFHNPARGRTARPRFRRLGAGMALFGVRRCCVAAIRRRLARCARRWRLTVGSGVLLDLLGQLAPGLGHPEQEQPSVGVKNALSEFDAIDGIQPVTGYVFPSH